MISLFTQMIDLVVIVAALLVLSIGLPAWSDKRIK